MKNYLKAGLLVLACLGIANLSSQSLLKQDSFYIDRGIAGTPDFETKTRSIILEHDTVGRPLEIVTHVNLANQWFPLRKRQISYLNNQISSVLIQIWNGTTQTFQDDQKRILNYNANDNLESRIYQKAPAPGMPLADNRRWAYEYDDQDRQISILFQKWENGIWENMRQQLFAYNSDGLPEEQLLQLWLGNTWRNFRRRTLSYHPAHKGLTEVVDQKWSVVEQVWVNTQRKDYNYNNEGLWSSELVQNWDSLSSAWQNENRQLFLSGPQGQFQGRLRQVWELEEWKNQFRGGQAFNGQILNIQFERWKDQTGEWVDDSRHLLNYDENSRLLLSQGWQRWDEKMAQWENDANTLRYTYYWSELMTPTSEVHIPNSCQITNPYSIGALFWCDLPASGQEYSLELFDLLGRKIYSATFTWEEQPTITQSLPNGAYILRIRQNERIFHLQQLTVF